MSTIRGAALTLIVGVLFILLHAAVEDAKLKMAVESGRIQFAPGFVRIRIRVEPDPANRALAVGIVGNDYESSSLETLNGERAPITRWREFRAVPAGYYDVLAELVRSDGSRSRAGDTVQIIGRE